MLFNILHFDRFINKPIPLVLQGAPCLLGALEVIPDFSLLFSIPVIEVELWPRSGSGIWMSSSLSFHGGI